MYIADTANNRIRKVTLSSTYSPSITPSIMPSMIPTAIPSVVPTLVPSIIPSGVPTISPTFVPSTNPTSQPSCQPSSIPSSQPSSEPTDTPSVHPTSQPSTQPSARPSTESTSPTSMLTTAPSKYIPPPTTLERMLAYATLRPMLVAFVGFFSLILFIYMSYRGVKRYRAAYKSRELVRVAPEVTILRDDFVSVIPKTSQYPDEQRMIEDRLMHGDFTFRTLGPFCPINSIHPAPVEHEL